MTKISTDLVNACDLEKAACAKKAMHQMKATLGQMGAEKVGCMSWLERCQAQVLSLWLELESTREAQTRAESLTKSWYGRELIETLHSSLRKTEEKESCYKFKLPERRGKQETRNQIPSYKLIGSRRGTKPL
jgi:hypothetical protein